MFRLQYAAPQGAADLRRLRDNQLRPVLQAPYTANTVEFSKNLLPNTQLERKGRPKNVEGAKKIKGNQKGTKMELKGSQREQKGNRKSTKMHPNVDQ